jgi:hypothetical protein
MDASTISKSLVRVGDGRGFVVEETVILGGDWS